MVKSDKKVINLLSSYRDFKKDLADSSQEDIDNLAYLEELLENALVESNNDYILSQKGFNFD